MRTILLMVFTILTVFSYNAISQENIEKGKRPNIIYMMSYDQGYQAINSYDDKLIHPPIIDRIAEEDTRDKDLGMEYDSKYQVFLGTKLSSD